MRMNNMTQNQTQAAPASKKISTYLALIVMIVMALAVVALLIAAYTYVNAATAEDQITAAAFGVIGAVALAMSVFTLFQSRKQVEQMKIDAPKVMTTIECQNKGCNQKTVREFQRGDYVYKEIDVPCTKCGGKQMITGIFKEIKEKEKTYNV